MEGERDTAVEQGQESVAALRSESGHSVDHGRAKVAAAEGAEQKKIEAELAARRDDVVKKAAAMRKQILDGHDQDLCSMEGMVDKGVKDIDHASEVAKQKVTKIHEEAVKLAEKAIARDLKAIVEAGRQALQTIDAIMSGARQRIDRIGDAADAEIGADAKHALGELAKAGADGIREIDGSVAAETKELGKEGAALNQRLEREATAEKKKMERIHKDLAIDIVKDIGTWRRIQENDKPLEDDFWGNLIAGGLASGGVGLVRHGVEKIAQELFAEAVHAFIEHGIEQEKEEDGIEGDLMGGGVVNKRRMTEAERRRREEAAMAKVKELLERRSPAGGAHAPEHR
jgi:hypothetical protein